MVRLVVLLVLIGATALGACRAEGAGARAPATSDQLAAASGASDGRAQRLDQEQVPADLRHLVPMAERWGIGDDVDRVAKGDRSTDAERKELETALEPHHARITAWLNSFGQGHMPDEAAAFMYMQLALEEMRAGRPR